MNSATSPTPTPLHLASPSARGWRGAHAGRAEALRGKSSPCRTVSPSPSVPETSNDAVGVSRDEMGKGSGGWGTTKTTKTTELGLGCEGHVATGDGSLAPEPDRRHRITAAARANVRLVGSGTTDVVGMDRTVMTDSAGGCAIGMTRQGEGSGRARPAARWPMGGTDRRQPGRTTTPADRCSGPAPKKAEGRRANADPIACLAGRDRCAVLRSSPVR